MASIIKGETPAKGAMGRPPHTITIRRDPDRNGFVVEVVPPFDGVGHDRECRSHKEAYGYGAGLRMTLGCQLLDLTAEANVTAVR